MVKIRFSSFSSQDSGINPFKELLLESVEELDFAEEELFVDEDETLSMLALSEDSFSGDKKLLLSSSPQAVKDIVMANSAAKINIVPL